MNLNDYNKQILEPSIQKLAREGLFAENYLYDRLVVNPPTKWQRFKYRMKDYRQRIKDIWAILRGKDIHEDCGR